MKPISLLLFLIVLLVFALPAQAGFCRQNNDHIICILSIKRSAKYHWEYRASVSVDGVERPIEIYNCRDRIRQRQDRMIVPFEHQGPGQLICSLLNR